MDAAEVDHVAEGSVVARDFGKRSSGEVCLAICLAVVEVGVRAVAGAVAEVSAAVVAVAVLAVGLVAEIVSVEAARVARGN